MTSSHIFFIPGMILLGLIMGFIFGARAARNQMDIQARRDAEREAARAARAARRGEKPADEPPPADAKPVEPTKPEAKEDKSELPTTPVKVKGGKKR